MISNTKTLNCTRREAIASQLSARRAEAARTLDELRRLFAEYEAALEAARRAEADCYYSTEAEQSSSRLSMLAQSIAARRAEFELVELDIIEGERLLSEPWNELDRLEAEHFAEWRALSAELAEAEAGLAEWRAARAN